jgi:hypothetical protein
MEAHLQQTATLVRDPFWYAAEEFQKSRIHDDDFPRVQREEYAAVEMSVEGGMRCVRSRF